MNDERMTPDGVTPGVEISEIEREIADLQSALGMIAAQLSERDRQDRTTGERLDWRDYAAWKSRALYARGAKEQQIRELRLRRKELLRQGQRMVRGGEDPIASHLARLCRVLIRRAVRGDLDNDEVIVLAEAKAALVLAYGDNALGGNVSS